MSPLFHHAERRERNAPADRLLAERMARLAVDLADAASEQPGLYSEEIDELCDLQISAQAYADVLQSDDPHAFFEHWYVYAAGRLAELNVKPEEVQP